VPDIAILKAVDTIPGRKTMPLLDESVDVEAGDTVYALGYPGASDAIESDTYGSKLVAGIEDVTLTRGIVSRLTESKALGEIDYEGSFTYEAYGLIGGNMPAEFVPTAVKYAADIGRFLCDIIDANRPK
jgi:hypothetical protein